MNENDVLFKKVTQAYSEKRNPTAPIRSQDFRFSANFYTNTREDEDD